MFTIFHAFLNPEVLFTSIFIVLPVFLLAWYVVCKLYNALANLVPTSKSQRIDLWIDQTADSPELYTPTTGSYFYHDGQRYYAVSAKPAGTKPHCQYVIAESIN